MKYLNKKNQNLSGIESTGHVNQFTRWGDKKRPFWKQYIRIKLQYDKTLGDIMP